MMPVTACEHQVFQATAPERTATVTEHEVLRCSETVQAHLMVTAQPSTTPYKYKLN